jgi:hypothetical protein
LPLLLETENMVMIVKICISPLPSFDKKQYALFLRSAEAAIPLGHYTMHDVAKLQLMIKGQQNQCLEAFDSHERFGWWYQGFIALAPSVTAHT